MVKKFYSPFSVCILFNFFSICYKEIIVGIDHVCRILLIFHHSQLRRNLFRLLYFPRVFLYNVPCCFYCYYILL
jgi:hypothetical protein